MSRTVKLNRALTYWNALASKSNEEDKQLVFRGRPKTVYNDSVADSNYDSTRTMLADMGCILIERDGKGPNTVAIWILTEPPTEELYSAYLDSDPNAKYRRQIQLNKAAVMEKMNEITSHVTRLHAVMIQFDKRIDRLEDGMRRLLELEFPEGPPKEFDGYDNSGSEPLPRMPGTDGEIEGGSAP